MEKLVLKNKRFLISLIIVMVIFSAFVAYDLIYKDVAINVDGDKIELTTNKATVSELLKENEINLDKKDYINVSLDERLKDGLEINIKKAVPITVSFDNKKIVTKTSKATVKEALDELEISYDYNDRLSHELDQMITPNIEIEIVKVEEKIILEEKDIPYGTITKENEDLNKGETKKLQDGELGVAETKIKAIYVNGVLETSEVLEEKVVKNPVYEIIEKGTKTIEIASRGSYSGKRSIVMTATAYDLSYESTGKRPGDKYYGITASGTMARPGVVAVDPKVIPLGTKLYIEAMDGTEDYGYAVAEDTGGAIKGNKIDLFFESSEDVKAYGRRKVKVYIIGE